MFVQVFYLEHPPNAEHRKVLESFLEGVMELGVDCDHKLTPISEYREQIPPDVAVIFGMHKKSLPFTAPRKTVLEGQKAAGKDCIVIDAGYVKRDKYYMVGLNGINGRAYFNAVKCPLDRWEQLGVPLKPWRENDPNKCVLLCGQVPWDAACQHVDHYRWLQETLREIRQRTDRTILFSRHPKGPPKLHMPGVQNVNTPNLKFWIEAAHCTVSFNSNSGVESVIEGVPTFAFDLGSMAIPVANRSLDKIEHPDKPDREQWAYNLAYCQWNVEEMREGLPFHHLMGDRL